MEENLQREVCAAGEQFQAEGVWQALSISHQSVKSHWRQVLGSL